jgi:lipoate-protein ligase B
MSGVLTACHLGPTPYREGIALQEALVRLRVKARGDGTGAGSAREDGARITDWLLFPDHPPVLTVGRSGADRSLRVDRTTLERMGIELFETARGGDITWHGPGQLVGYPILDLNRRGRDLHRLLRDLEQALILPLEGWGVPACRLPGRTGVWAGERKIASIGIAVRQWVSYHGFALNVMPDLAAFELIHPCGLRGIEMTSVAALQGPDAPGLDRARVEVARAVARRLGYGEVRWAGAEEVRRLAAAGAAPVVGASLGPEGPAVGAHPIAA